MGVEVVSVSSTIFVDDGLLALALGVVKGINNGTNSKLWRRQAHHIIKTTETQVTNEIQIKQLWQYILFMWVKQTTFI